MAVQYILQQFGKFYGYSVYFTAIWYILWLLGVFSPLLFSPLWYVVTKENLATLLLT
jgi:hypothetical protein